MKWQKVIVWGLGGMVVTANGKLLISYQNTLLILTIGFTYIANLLILKKLFSTAYVYVSIHFVIHIHHETKYFYHYSDISKS